MTTKELKDARRGGFQPRDGYPSSGDQQEIQTPVYSSANPNEVRRIRELFKDRMRRHAQGDMFTETRTITPAQAEYILEYHNPGNRPIRRNKIEKYSTALREGRWKHTSQGISFSREGLLNNGQHRLIACVETARPIKLRVTWGEEREVFDVLDTPALRSAPDSFSLLGYPNPKTLAAGLRLFNIIVNKDNTELTNDQMTALLAQNPQMPDVTATAEMLAKKFKAPRSSLMCFLYLVQQRSKNPVKITDFVRKLVDGDELEKGSPILLLREGMRDKSFDSRGRKNAVAVAYCNCFCMVKAWNAWVNKRKLKALRIDHKSKSLPVVE